MYAGCNVQGAPDGHWVATFVSTWKRTEDGWRVLLDVGPRCPPAEPSDSLRIGISGTVKPIHERVVAQLEPEFPDLQIEFIPAGTSDGFRRLAAGTADVIGSSRSIHADELESLASVPFIELPIALDGIAMVVPASNDWLDHLTFDELKRLWSGEAVRWNDLRADWPDQPIDRHSYGPASGTVASLLGVLGLSQVPSSREDWRRLPARTEKRRIREARNRDGPALAAIQPADPHDVADHSA